MKQKKKHLKQIIIFSGLVFALLVLVGWRLNLALSKGHNTTLEIVKSSDKVYVGGAEGNRRDQKIRFNAIVKDESGNPISTQEVVPTIVEGRGLIEMWNKFTDENGVSSFDYTSGNVIGKTLISIVNKSSRNKVSEIVEVEVVDREATDENIVIKVSVEPKSLVAGDVARIIAKVITESGKPVDGHSVEFKLIEGRGNFQLLKEQVRETNDDGEVTVHYTSARVPEDCVIRIIDLTSNPSVETLVKITTTNKT